jgi:hypothetical protein
MAPCVIPPCWCLALDFMNTTTTNHRLNAPTQPQVWCNCRSLHPMPPVILGCQQDLTARNISRNYTPLSSLLLRNRGCHTVAQLTAKQSAAGHAACAALQRAAKCLAASSALLRAAMADISMAEAAVSIALP